MPELTFFGGAVCTVPAGLFGGAGLVSDLLVGCGMLPPKLSTVCYKTGGSGLGSAPSVGV